MNPNTRLESHGWTEKEQEVDNAAHHRTDVCGCVIHDMSSSKLFIYCEH